MCIELWIEYFSLGRFISGNEGCDKTGYTWKCVSLHRSLLTDKPLIWGLFLIGCRCQAWQAGDREPADNSRATYRKCMYYTPNGFLLIYFIIINNLLLFLLCICASGLTSFSRWFTNLNVKMTERKKQWKRRF